ncbi:flagellar motor protein MotA [Natronospira bacteriovora]|uniref:Flagellar motor protein MotA n=1 Tax=Natronospira bacteriovora TaxID=3069753 RepID=A0ABU0W7Q8_9GAMM|nr:flagellar motor protein MotA [Natronospira sp. AB-CW4]MDQ2070036.1 flagellar motor protein MotA [Natronospira sp. AB-CW4]
MRNPSRVMIWMAVFLMAVAVVCLLLLEPLQLAFQANPIFNGLILAVLAVGILINFRQVLILQPEQQWIQRFRQSGGKARPKIPRTRILGSMARLLTGRDGQNFSLSTLSLRTLLDGVRSRLDESRDLSRYFIGLLVFLGLLGTFWGLLDTLRAVGQVISGLSIEDRSATAFFEELKTGLEAPLGGMGTAFSSSLFGLAGAVVLGFIDLQAATAQNRFFNDLEEWLSGQTRLSSGALAGGEDASVPAYIQALLEQTADSLEQLQRMMQRSEEDRRAADSRLAELAGELARLAEQSQSERKGLTALTRSQSELRPILERLADSQEQQGRQDADMGESLTRLARATEQLQQELGRDREQTLTTLREELRLLTRTLANQGRGSGES